MSNIGIFATPDSEEALQKYMTLFSVASELFAADLGYTNYKDILTQGEQYVTKLLTDNGLERDVTIVLVTVAGMRWNLLDKQNDNEPTRDTESNSSTD